MLLDFERDILQTPQYDPFTFCLVALTISKGPNLLGAELISPLSDSANRMENPDFFRGQVLHCPTSLA